MTKLIDNATKTLTLTLTRPAVWGPLALITSAIVITTGAWEWLEPFTGVLTLAAAGVAVLQTRRATIKVRKSGEAGPLTIVNWSGHPLTVFEDGWAEGAQMVDAAVHLDISSTDALRRSVEEAILGLPAEVRHRLMAADPNVVLVPPNLPAGMQILLATLHGVIGEFPRVTWSRRVEGTGFVWMKPVDLQAVRLEARHRLRVGGAFKNGNE